jgi:AraC-like DNA-binding protein
MTDELPLPDHSRRDVRMDGVYFCRASVDGPFAKSLDPGNYSYCVMVRAGRLRFESDFPKVMSVELGPGDAVGLSGLSSDVFRSLDMPSADEVGRFNPRDLADPAPPGAVELVLGVAPSESIALASLMIGPIIVRGDEHPGLSRRLWAAVDMLEEEYADTSWIDREPMIRRIAEIMLLTMGRRVFADHREAPADAAPSPASRPIMLAINAFFRAPESAWTLADLAKAAGMSRSRFAEEFKLSTGQTPARIISRMRLTATARRLATEALSVEAAAEDAGYSSAVAFVRAFQREFGETPARWRRHRRGDEPRSRRAASQSPAGSTRRTRHEAR